MDGNDQQRPATTSQLGQAPVPWWERSGRSGRRLRRGPAPHFPNRAKFGLCRLCRYVLPVASISWRRLGDSRTSYKAQRKSMEAKEALEAAPSFASSANQHAWNKKVRNEKKGAKER